MPKVRRTGYLFFYLHDGRVLDIELLLRGVAQLSPVQQVWAISVLHGEEHPLLPGSLQLLANIPSDRWVEMSEVAQDAADLEAMRRFMRNGVVLCDEQGAPFEEFRRRDEALSSGHWNIYASLYHSMKKWHDMHLRLEAAREVADASIEPGDTIDRFLAEFGDPPHHFHSVDGSVRELPLVKKSGALYDVLEKRKTTRGLDRDTPLEIDDFASLLYEAFGCHGYAAASDDVWSLKKTSPSGGSMHPIEVYPMVRNVRMVDPGLYHYGVERHALELVASKSQAEVADLAYEFTAGQPFARDAPALFILAARFPRSFWKYRRQEKAYGVVLMDAGHLSQTFYLVCADLGLGAFVTAAINDVNVEMALGLDGFTEGVIAMLGCGKPAAAGDPFSPTFLPYSPRQEDHRSGD